MVSKRAATLADVQGFKLRQEDIEEIWASTRLNAADALRASFDASEECWAGEMDGEVFCIFGCVPTVDGGNLWMLFADGLKSLPLTFYRQSRQHLCYMLAKYGYLSNHVDARNSFIIGWVKWLGFTVEDAKPYGADGQPFHRFYKRRD